MLSAIVQLTIKTFYRIQRQALFTVKLQLIYTELNVFHNAIIKIVAEMKYTQEKFLYCTSYTGYEDHSSKCL